MNCRRFLLLPLLLGSLYAAPSLIVLNKEDATLAVIDVSTGKTTGVVKTGEAPHEVAVSADGQLAFVANYGARTPGNSISVIDLPGRKELRRVEVTPFGRPHGIDVAEGKAYFTAEANKLVARYDPATNRIDWVMGTGQNATHMVMASAGGNRLFTANIGSDTITILERAPNGAWNATQIPVGKGPEGFDLSPDGRELWAAHSGDGGVSIIDVAAKKVTGTMNLQTKRSNRLKFTPDGKMVLVSDLGGDELIAIDPATRKEIRRMKIGRQPEGILIPGDGHAYVAVSGENRIAIVDLPSLEVKGNIETGRGPDGMAWVK